MSDEDLVQCPYNPNHHVPRSQIDEHKNTCKFLMDPNQETQITFSSHDEPRPSTSYQELPQEDSSLQEGSSQQEESQKAELPNLQSPSFLEWRPPKDPTKLQEKSSSGLKRSRPNLRSFRKRGILAESEIESCKPKLEQDKKSSSKKPEMRIESYYKILHEKMKLLEKLKIDSGSDEDSSSSSGSTLSLIDTMPAKKKKILYDMGTEFQEELRSTSQQTGSSQQESSSPKPKMTGEEIDKQTDVERWVIQSSRFMSEVTTPLEVKLEEPPSTGDVLHEQSQSFSVPTETTHDSDRSEKTKMTDEQIPEKMDTEEKNNAQVSPTLSERITQIEIKLEKLSLAADVSKKQLQSVSSPTKTKEDSDRSQKPKMTEEQIPEQIGTEEKNKAQVSPTLSERITQIEIKLEKLSLAADVPQQQLQSVSFPIETKQDSDRSQQPKTTKERKPEEIDTEAKIETEESHTLSEVTTQLEVELEEPSLAADAPLQQSQPFSFPAATTHDSDDSQQSEIISKKKHEEMDTKEKIQTEESHTLSEVTIQVEVESEESSLFEAVPQQQSQSISFPAATTHVSDDLQQPNIISKKKHEEMYTEAEIHTEESHTLSEVTIQVEGESEESSLLEVVPQQQSQHFRFPAATTHDSEDLQQQISSMKEKYAEIIEEEIADAEVSHILATETNLQQQISSMKEKYAEIIEEEIADAEVSHILATETNLQLIKTEEPSSSKAVPEIIVTFHGETTNDESQQADISQQESSSLQENSSLQEDSLLQGGSSLQEDSLLQGGSLQQEDSSQPEESFGEELSDMFSYLHSKDTGSSAPTSSLQEEQSEPVVSHDKAKHQLDVPQEASRQRKRSYSTSSESTDIDIGDLQKAGSSPKSAISPEADSSQRKKKFLEIRRRFEAASTKDKDTDEKIDLEKPSTSSSKKRSKAVVSRGKTKHQLDVPQEASRQRKRSYSTSSEDTDIDIGDLQKAGSSPKSAISPEADSSQRKKKFLEIRRRFEAASTKDKDTDEQIDLEKPSTSSSTKQSQPVVSRGKTKHQSDVPQEASRLRKRLYETSSEDTDIDVDDIPLAVTPPKSDISPKAYVSPRKKKCLDKSRRSDSSSKTDED